MRIWKKYGGAKSKTASTLDKQKNQDQNKKQSLSTNLDLNLERIKQVLGNARDLMVREITVGSNDEVKAAVIAIGGLADRTLVNEQVLKTLMLDIRFPRPLSSAELFERNSFFRY